MEHKMSDERVFTGAEIQAAIDNYRLQAASVEKQLQELGRQVEHLQATQHMVNGAILAFESLLSVQVEPPAPPADPPNET